MPKEVAAQLLAVLRDDRPPPDGGAVKPLHIEPAGSLQWQWEPADAMEHAMYVLESSSCADLDAAYRRCLVTVGEVEDDRARAVVEDLANYRHPRGDG